MAFLARSFVLSTMSGASERSWLRTCPRYCTVEQNFRECPKKINIRSALNSITETNELSLINIEYKRIGLGKLITSVQHQSRGKKALL